MIIVITYYDEKLGKELVSHGIDSETLQNKVLPNERPKDIGARWSIIQQSYILD